eukprot:TRINITY_DN4_c0_g1_i2.p1 TRINITY_DN4_c0_g1~~TRINITY_DN4_c0_g1_i2.p1  ORF type:complete len:341 (-),score=41.28 TRINITY_DN4_c0_g1_i2:171-1193(-)
MIRRPPRSTLSSSSAASDVYKRQGINAEYGRLGDAMGARPSAEKRRKQQRQKEHPEREERRAVVQASPPLVLNMEAPIQCQVDAHEAETVQELLEALAVDRFELRKADAEKLTLEFGDEPMSERHRTLVAIGMCDQAEFSVLGVAQTKAAKACSGGSCAAERVCAGGHLGCRVQWTGGGGAPRVGRLPRASGRNLEQQPDLAAHRRRIRADRGGRHTGAGQGQHPCPKPVGELCAALRRDQGPPGCGRGAAAGQGRPERSRQGWQHRSARHSGEEASGGGRGAAGGPGRCEPDQPWGPDRAVDGSRVARGLRHSGGNSNQERDHAAAACPHCAMIVLSIW